MKSLLAALALGCLAAPALAGQPFHDAVHPGGPQRIPGAVFCAYYDEGGEGVAYHDHDAENQGSGKLNPADGTYLNEFRRHEGVDISYTKQIPDLDSPCNKVVPPLGLLYVGWTEPGEWFNLTVEAAAAGTYVADLLYTAQRDATLALDVNGVPAAPFALVSTFDAAETIPWRQWHHWNVARDVVSVTLPRASACSRCALSPAAMSTWPLSPSARRAPPAPAPASRRSRPRRPEGPICHLCSAPHGFKPQKS